MQMIISVGRGEGVRLMGGDIGRLFGVALGGILVIAVYEVWALSIVS